MSLKLKLIDEEEIFSINLTYNYSGMWALAMGKEHHDPPKSFLYPVPKNPVRLLEVEGLTGKESMAILHHGIEAMVSDMVTYRFLNPSNGWGSADLFLENLFECLKAADENPDAIWEAHR